MNHYRITKYNPINRDNQGQYNEDDWTSIYDIENYHKSIEEYYHFENGIINVLNKVFSSLNDFKLTEIELNKINPKSYVNTEMIDEIKKIKNCKTKNLIYATDNIDLLIKLILREVMWGKLVLNEDFVHFGYDLYVYIGTSKKLEDGFIEENAKNNIYIEEFISPYL